MRTAFWLRSVALLALLLGWGRAWGFDPDEHKHAGDEASKRVLSQYGGEIDLLNPVGNRWATVEVNGRLRVWVGGNEKGSGRWLTIGDLISIYGDFRNDVHDLLTTGVSSLKILQRITETGKADGKRIGMASLPTMVGETLKGKESARTWFYDLAAYNETHFHLSAVRTYARNHLEALRLAALAALKNDPKPLWIALHYEALALHSYTDLFAGGHVFVDRGPAVRDLRSNPILQKARSALAALRKIPIVGSKISANGLWRILGVASAAVGGALHNVINDAHVELITGTGKRFHAWGDESFFRKDHRLVQATIAGTEESLRSLFRAYVIFRNNRAAIADTFRLQARGEGFSAINHLPMRYTNLPVDILRKGRAKARSLVAYVIDALAGLLPPGVKGLVLRHFPTVEFFDQSFTKLYTSLSSTESGEVPHAKLARALLKGKTPMQKRARFHERDVAARTCVHACARSGSLQFKECQTSCIAEVLREKPDPGSGTVGPAALSEGRYPEECRARCPANQRACLEPCKAELVLRAEHEARRQEAIRKREEQERKSKEFSGNVCQRGGDWLAVCNLYHKVIRCWPNRAQATRNSELVRIVRTVVQGARYRDFSSEQIKRLRLEGEAAAEWCQTGRPFVMPSHQPSTNAVAAAAGPFTFRPSPFTSTGEKNALRILAGQLGAAPRGVPSCLRARQQEAYLAAIQKPARALTTEEARLILEFLWRAGLIDLRPGAYSSGAEQLDGSCSPRRFSARARITLGPWVRFAPGALKPSSPTAEPGRVGFVYNPGIKRIGSGPGPRWNRAWVKKMTSRLDNLHPRMAVALYRLAGHLSEKWGVTELHHAGTASAGAEHSDGRAIDFAGVSGLEGGRSFEYFVYYDWGTKPVPADRRQPGWPASQWRHADNITSYRLAQQLRERSAAFFADFYRSAHAQFTTTGPESLGTGGRIGLGGTILHPDYSKSSPARSPSARQIPANGREAHANHIHLPIDASVSSYVASAATVSPRPIASYSAPRPRPPAAHSAAPTSLPGLINLARHMYVRASSRHPRTPDGRDVVSGRIARAYAIHTNRERSAWVMVDLRKSHKLSRVRIYNRGDGWFDDGLPMALELSNDGRNFMTISRQTRHFSQKAPWEVDVSKLRARYVRVRSLKPNGYVALSQIAVIGESKPRRNANLALDKRVTASSLHSASPPPSALVNGVWEWNYGIHTRTGRDQWVMVDLGATRTIGSVRVFNRGDGWFDGGFPLVLELSEDGRRFWQVSTRKRRFTVTSPWTTSTRGRRARFVRVRSAKPRGYVALTEIEVWGH